MIKIFNFYQKKEPLNSYKSISKNMENPALIQQDYYQKTANRYDSMHIHTGDEHEFAFAWMSSLIELFKIRSVLDVGAGTGRTVTWLKQHFPDLRVAGVEPVAGLREAGYRKGLSREELMDGDGNNLKFRDGEFDLVCEFGVLHHVPKPNLVVGEMLRVAKRGIFISDSNNFGQGGFAARTMKQAINAFGLWPAYNFLRTKGKRYQINEGDGLFYSYSVFNSYRQISQSCERIHLMNSQKAGSSIYRSSSSVALFGLKK